MVTPERTAMVVTDFERALDGQLRDVFGYLETLGGADLGQLAKIRAAAGLPAAG